MNDYKYERVTLQYLPADEEDGGRVNIHVTGMCARTFTPFFALTKALSTNPGVDRKCR